MHIDNRELDKFRNNEMETQDMIAFLEHLDDCEYCLEQMVQQEEENSIKAPAYLKQQILDKASGREVQAAKAVSETSQKIQMFYYGIRTAAGVLAALLLLFTVGQWDLSAISQGKAVQTEREAEKTYEGQQRNQLYDFTREIGTGISQSTGVITDYLNDFFK